MNLYQTIKQATSKLFHDEEPQVRFSRRSKRSFRWLTMQTRNSRNKP
ncbi:hypothetical protein SAMN02745165_01302 [Malonomonas rubra DSM 5091]|uniref:Uncharacterized protein n=1 Tax=Malonomonas rubra DSM 5091 TaxID=1122189 RepID=A0A1M6FIP3_MALRU|nr:hypothetical protein [Malonomonas rubra]SHI97534.1 hypothetical protein SAMN02745165_01302 [Malonomonas rubra DSM 5091]